MKVCHMEAMKEIRALEEKKAALHNEEYASYRISYREDEEKIGTDYSYETTREAIAEVDRKIRKIKCALARANSTVVLDGFDITIGEGLIYLAQLNEEYNWLLRLTRGRKPLERQLTSSGALEYTECLIDLAAVKAELEQRKRTISALQIAIDRANLLNFIEI